MSEGRLRVGQATVMERAEADVEADVSVPRRLAYVDGLRALAALYVVFGHMMMEVWAGGLPGGFAGALATPVAYGHYAVSAFIVISGFSLMLPVERAGRRLKGGAWRFFARRARRILPPYYLAMGLSLALIWLLIGQKTGTHWDVSLPVTWADVARHVFLVQDFSTTAASINHVFWSIALECQIYLVFPALVLLWRRVWPPVSATLVLLVAYVGLLEISGTWVGQLPNYSYAAFAPQYLGLFAMGMFAATVLFARKPGWVWIRAHFPWTLAGLACLGLLAAHAAQWWMPAGDIFMGCATAFVIIGASRVGRFNLARKALSFRPLVWIGGFSYSLYLIHAPLIQVLWQYGLHPLGLGAVQTYLALLVVGTPLIVLTSWVFYRWCERPFLNSRPAASAASPERAPVVAGLVTRGPES